MSSWRKRFTLPCARPRSSSQPAELGELLLGDVLSGELDCAGLEDAADTEQLAHDFAVEVDDQGERLDDPGWVEVAYEGPCALAAFRIPIAVRVAMLSRSAGREMPYLSISWRSAGSFSPGLKMPVVIRRMTCSRGSVVTECETSGAQAGATAGATAKNPTELPLNAPQLVRCA